MHTTIGGKQSASKANRSKYLKLEIRVREFCGLHIHNRTACFLSFWNIFFLENADKIVISHLAWNNFLEKIVPWRSTVILTERVTLKDRNFGVVPNNTNLHLFSFAVTELEDCHNHIYQPSSWRLVCPELNFPCTFSCKDFVLVFVNIKNVQCIWREEIKLKLEWTWVF